MSASQFDAVRADYIAGVAVALARDAGDVRIVSVVEVLFSPFLLLGCQFGS